MVSPFEKLTVTNYLQYFSKKKNFTFGCQRFSSRNVVHVLSSADLLPALKTLLATVSPREIADLIACREDAKGKLGKSIKEGVEKLCEGIIERKY